VSLLALVAREAPGAQPGIQYVAVAGGMKNPIIQTDSGPAWVAIFALPDQPRR